MGRAAIHIEQASPAGAGKSAAANAAGQRMDGAAFHVFRENQGDSDADTTIGRKKQAFFYLPPG
jgi:hypothetical protein